jgi:lipid A 3-O-deacylase
VFKPIRLAAIAAIAFVASNVQAPAAEPENGTFSVVFENDLFYGQDRDYTNGVLLSWTSGPNRGPGFLLDVARLFPLFAPPGTVRISYGLGQNLYTPRDTSLFNPPLDDRPYAGWLYGSIGLIAESGPVLDQLQLQVGVIGPWALGEEAQKFVHRIRNLPQPNGWGHQLKNEPGFVLTYEKSWRALWAETFLGLGADFTPHVGGAVGNVFTYANAGAMLRVGLNLPNDYGPPRIQPSLPGSGFFEPAAAIGIYLFGGVDGRAVARNIFLDGNTWQNSRSVDKEIFVGDVQFGAAVTFGFARLAYTHVYRSKEFKTQKSTDEFGSVSLSVRF